MIAPKVIGYSAGALLLLGAVAISFFLGDRYAVEHLRIQRATPDQLASAMDQDRFYSDYRDSTIVVSGIVASVERKTGGAVLRFQTTTKYSAACQFDSSMASARVGDPITAVSPGALAERAGHEVLLHGCVSP